MSIATTLTERNSVHGDFAQNARIYRKILEVFEAEPGWTRLTDIQKACLHMDAMKTARILSGDPNHHDHWHDKAGYATLAEQLIKALPRITRLDDTLRAETNGMKAVTNALTN